MKEYLIGERGRGILEGELLPDVARTYFSAVYLQSHTVAFLGPRMHREMRTLYAVVEHLARRQTLFGLDIPLHEGQG